MSSWSGSAYPPPPRRSRSRSPYRAGYPPRAPYPDPAYPQDPYRTDWEAYDRDRAWANYERDKAAYDYGRRGRSRSPPIDDAAGRKRRRSSSPYDRERYDPRPRYGDDYDAPSRGYAYSPPRGRGQYGPSARSGRPPLDPHTFDYPASLKQFAEWFRYNYPQQAIDEDVADKAAEQEAGDGSKPRNGIKSKWEKYKKDFAGTQLQTMFEHHRKSPWFAEKYDPSSDYVNLRARVRKEGWKGRIDTFLLDLEAGKFDPSLSEPEPEPTSPVKSEPESASPIKVDSDVPMNGQNGEEAHVSVAPIKEEVKGEDEFVALEGEDEPAENQPQAEANGKIASDGKRSVRPEEISVPTEGNQVMIRTIPPDIGRVKLEDALGQIPGFIHLALGDPLQKRNYYRAGWIKFDENADMPSVLSELAEKKIEGFKLHVTHNTRPFQNKIRQAPEVASKPDRMEKDLANAKALVVIMEEEAAALRKKNFERNALPTAQADVSGAPDEPHDVSMNDGDAGDEPEPRETGSEAIERRVEKILADLREHGSIDLNDDKAMVAKKTMITLDLYLAYLRAAFHVCYYCVAATDHIEELQRKCVKHLRKPLSKMLLEELKAAEAEKAEKAEKEQGDNKDSPVKSKPAENRDWKRNDERWLEWLDSKIALLINRAGVDPRDYGGKSYEEELTKAVEAHIKQEDEGKFRCKTCQKLFKATAFVEKHVANKHPELVKQLEEIPYFNNFALDPHHIQPFAHPPPPVGTQPPIPQAYGLQSFPVHGPDFGRGPPPYNASYPYPPTYMNGGHWDHHAYHYGAGAFPPPRRDDMPPPSRRLSERLGGFADIPGEGGSLPPPSAGLPAKPPPSVEHGSGGRRGGRAPGGPPPPPPPDAKEDPRAAAGKKVSYHDMDLVAEGDVELTY